MRKILEELLDEGVEVEEALDRLSGNEDLYLSLLVSLTKESTMSDLASALKAGDIKGGIKYSHILKGVTLNLGLLPLSYPCVEILQALRANDLAEAKEIMPEAEKLFSELKGELRPYLAEGEQ